MVNTAVWEGSVKQVFAHAAFSLGCGHTPLLKSDILGFVVLQRLCFCETGEGGGGEPEGTSLISTLTQELSRELELQSLQRSQS